jgi:hypothetical protein
MKGEGAIHISEIEPTLRRLEQDLGFDLCNNMLGSTGKRTISGDIDVAVQLDKEQIPILLDRLNKCKIVDFAKKSVLVVIARVEIQNYDSTVETDQPRTGYVQVDFMTDPNIAWLKTFYHAPAEGVSKYKGAHRNITLGALSQYVDRYETNDPIDMTPLTKRYMFSSNRGLVRITREPKPRKDGKGYTKQVINTVIDGPWYSPAIIVARLKLDSIQNLDSFETVWASILKNQPSAVVSRIARDLEADPNIQKLGVPDEIKEYLK